MNHIRRQSGTVLVVVVVLLLLASVLSLFALNTGIFEQRTSGNDLRAKMVSEVAEAGLAQGMEFLHQNPKYVLDTSKWTLCKSTDTTFPCGSVPPARRGSMYYWSSTGSDFDGSGTISGWEGRMLPLATANLVTSVGNGAPVNYGVGAVLCRVAGKTAATDPTTCTDSASASSTSVITFVSVAALPGESARTTVTQAIGSFNLLNGLTSAPPILASGSVDVTGGLQVVTNPNSGGAGVPVSVWSRKALTKTGTPNTCYYNEFLHNSAGGSNGTVYLDPASPNYPLCDNCTCNGADSLSYTNSGNKVSNGIDILQNSGLNSDYTKPLAAGYANYDVKPQEFPCDLFAQVFRVSAWKDLDGDNFCETKITASFKNPSTGVATVMGADEAYLFQNAKTIIATAAVQAAGLVTASQSALPSGTDAKGLAATGYPNSGFNGIVWCQTNCDIGSGQQLGSPSNPVLLVVDGSAKIQGKVFGLVFLRTLAGTATLTPSTGYTMTATEITNGGNAALTMNSGAVVYGAVVLQGQVTKANGTSSVVYNSDVIQTLLGEGSLNKFVGMPGGWTDRTSY
ncbi:MAG: hypothetical protein HOQ02_08070 [Lysobacter sp.]|nr:hypothetical protein [Lysobacter sp.]